MKYGVMIVTDVVVPKSYPTRRVSTSTGELLEHVDSNVFHNVHIKTKKNIPHKLTSKLFLEEMGLPITEQTCFFFPSSAHSYGINSNTGNLQGNLAPFERRYPCLS